MSIPEDGTGGVAINATLDGFRELGPAYRDLCFDGDRPMAHPSLPTGFVLVAATYKRGAPNERPTELFVVYDFATMRSLHGEVGGLIHRIRWLYGPASGIRPIIH